jgi:SAM-dependent methyltransferase
MKNLRRRAAGVAHRLLLNPNVRKLSQKLPFLRHLTGGLYRTHPFDEIYGVDTSGGYPTELLQTKEVTSNLIIIYIGSQPSITRGALLTLPDVTDYTFVDLGCGKGRVVIIGSEFPFRNIVGIEISPELARIARSNVDKIQRQFPGRPPIAIITGNALEDLPVDGKIVFYIYHSFGRELMFQPFKRLSRLSNRLWSMSSSSTITRSGGVFGTPHLPAPLVCRHNCLCRGGS